MLKNHWNTLKLIRNRWVTLSPENFENISNFEGGGLNLAAHKEKYVAQFRNVFCAKISFEPYYVFWKFKSNYVFNPP